LTLVTFRMMLLKTIGIMKNNNNNQDYEA